jgi:hypothetical protein
VVAHVEATQHCYRERAIALAREAINGLKVKSKTVSGTPYYIESRLPDEEEIFFSSYGRGIEVWREDVLREWSERTQQRSSPVQTASSSTMPRRRRPREAGIIQAIRDSWPDGIPENLIPKDRNNKIYAWHEEHGIKIPKDKNISRQIQRALQEHPKLYGPARNSEAVETDKLGHPATADEADG